MVDKLKQTSLAHAGFLCVIITMRRRFASRGGVERPPAAFPHVPFCSKVSDMSKTQIFIEKARAVHGDLYGYDRVAYVRNRDKIVITCAKHGDFEQTPDNHLKGNGCARCAGRYIYSTQEWVEEAVAVHGDRYDYSKAVYVRSSDKITITCKTHGDFEQRPNDHLKGKSCAKCAGVHRHSTQEWIQEAVAVHGDRYGYERVVYVRNKDKIIITCKKHGDFEQTPDRHLKGDGCAKCAGLHRYSTQEWIQEAVAVHGDRYSYERVVYVRVRDKVIITCRQHGAFEQAPNSHLNGVGCPSCPRRYDQPTNLYLMYNGLGKVKVGYTIDLNRRITELNRDAPFETELLETWTLPDTPTVRKIEGKVHRTLAKYHAGLSGFEGATEWFNTSPEIAKAVIMKSLSGTEVLGHSEANSLQLALI